MAGTGWQADSALLREQCEYAPPGPVRAEGRHRKHFTPGNDPDALFARQMPKAALITI